VVRQLTDGLTGGELGTSGQLRDPPLPVSFAASGLRSHSCLLLATLLRIELCDVN
jgi:hypothetical protein